MIEAYKKDVDRTILRAVLELSVEERLRALMRLQRASPEMRRAGRDARTPPTEFESLLKALAKTDVEYVIVGGGTFDELVSHSVLVEAFGVQCRCIDLPHLIRVKRASGRPKDLEAIAELEALLEESSEE